MTATYYAISRIENKLFNGATLTSPATYYLACSTSTPSADGTGFTEPVGANYSRLAVPADGTNWSTSTTNTLVNNLILTFPQSSASWGTIIYIGFFDASTSGNMWFYSALSPSRTVDSNTTLYFDPSGITVSMP